MYRNLIFLIAMLFSSHLSFGGDEKSITRNEYITMWKDEAVYQMALHKIPASITLAQGILESGDGNSRLAREGNNHFGIKCHEDWKGKRIMEDDETKGECFRKYDNARESFEDHSTFLQRKRYEPLFKLSVDNYEGWAKGLKECGYATNPKYPQLLIGIIKEFGLDKYDDEGKKFINKNQVPARPKGTTVAPEKTETPTVIAEEKPRSKKHHKDRGEERLSITITNNRELKVSENRIRFITAKAGDTPESIAKDLDIAAWQICRYNDLESTDRIKEGQVIYTQPKRNKAKEESCSVKKGDTAWSISQQHGLKLKKLCQLNSITKDAPLPVGKTLRLRK